MQDDGDNEEQASDDEIETDMLDSSAGTISQDPYELSKPGTGTFHPAVNELRQYIRMLVIERNQSIKFS